MNAANGDPKVKEHQICLHVPPFEKQENRGQLGKTGFRQQQLLADLLN